jgi:hypothetical protein
MISNFLRLLQSYVDIGMSFSLDFETCPRGTISSNIGAETIRTPAIDGQAKLVISGYLAFFSLIWGPRNADEHGAEPET